MDPNVATTWHDLFVGMVAAGASLAGLTFVAVALDPHSIERTPLLRLRAASALGCFASVLFIGIAILTPRPFGIASALIVGVGGVTGFVLVVVSTYRQQLFRGGRPGVNRLRGSVNILGFLAASVGGFSLAVMEQGWVYYTLALACVAMLATGIYASWLLVLQIGVPLGDKPSDTA